MMAFAMAPGQDTLNILPGWLAMTRRTDFPGKFSLDGKRT